MLRRLIQFCALLFLAVVFAVGCWYVQSLDPRYVATETIFWPRYHRYDDLITSISHRRGLDPMLVKALIWRESRFHPEKHGLSGERGLMQVGPAAASEWAKAEHSSGVTPDDLLDPKTNIEAGTWLLARALHRWQQTTNDPVPFALAEYNAGHSRVERWAADAESKEHDSSPSPQSLQSPQPGVQVNGADLTTQIKIPSTRKYVETVEGRLRFYKLRGRF